MFQTDRERKFSNHEVVSESEGMAKGMKLQQDARVTLQNMKEDAQDLCAEAKQKAAQETAEEA